MASRWPGPTDSAALVSLETGEFETLLTFPEYRPLLERFSGASVWIPTLSWSEDGYLAITVHGPPYADEAPQDSIIFDVAVINPATDLEINPFLTRGGIWASPTYSPVSAGPGGARYAIAYFRRATRSTAPARSTTSWWPTATGATRASSSWKLTGPAASDPEDGIAWSPSARQIALIHQGNLWVIDVKTGRRTRLRATAGVAPAMVRGDEARCLFWACLAVIAGARSARAAALQAR